MEPIHRNINTDTLPHIGLDTYTTASVQTPLPTALFVFDLPPDLVSTLVLHAQSDAIQFTAPTVDEKQKAPGTASPAVASSLDSAIPSCRICGIAQLESVEKQREHVKLDWHRYNLKQQLLDKSCKPITEQQFENMIQDLSSISGSDDSEDSDYNGGSSEVRTPRSGAAATAANSKKNALAEAGADDQEALIQSLMRKLEIAVKENQKARNKDPLLIHQQQVLEQQLQEAKVSPLMWFTSPLYSNTVRLGIYKNALPNRGQGDDIPNYLQSLQLPRLPPKKKKNKRAAREAKRIAAEKAAAEQAAAQESAASDNACEPLEDSECKTDEVNGESQEEDEEEEEEEVEEEVEEEPYDENQEQEWEKYNRLAKEQPETTQEQPATPSRYWTLIMIGGGHFAGLVIDLAGQVTPHGRELKIMAHKTFHRYTVRRKQGGSQAAHGIANSAGARIRMYNEEALKLEVRELLDSWSPWIKESECVFVHSPGNNRKVLYYENSVLSAADRQGRLRSIPFLTRRATLSELKRAYQELTTVKISVLTQAALERAERMEQEALEQAMEASAAVAAKGTVAEKAPQEVTLPEASAELLKMVELTKKGRAEALSSHLLKHGIDPSQLLPLIAGSEYDIRRTPTILHLASHHGQAQVVKILLEKHHADPTTTTVSDLDPDFDLALGASSLTAYDVAKDKETRNAFRRAMALLPDSWDWVGTAHVPSALTPEMEAEQERKAKEKTRKLLEAERERKKTREASRPVTPVQSQAARPGSPAASSMASASLMSKNMASVTAANTHLTPELRMRLERERRAQAAEARMAAMKQTETVRRAVQEGKNVCVACGKSLDSLVPFDKFGRKFCSTDCVAKGPA